MKTFGIYIHIPFCVRKCGYCDFNSIAFSDYEQIEKYLTALEKDILLSADMLAGYKIKSIYIGGGTPSVIKAEGIGRLLDIIRREADLVEDTEITIEANPSSVTASKAESWFRSGINRVSVGVQSFNQSFLDLLQRAHTAEQAFKAIETFRKNGFKNVSIDLIYGMPGQTLDDWVDDLGKAAGCDIGHISLYDLKIEKGTPFYEIRDSLKIADSELQIKMYDKACCILGEKGFQHYEISSFARPGKMSGHNRIYWRNQSYAGFGAGAYSYLNGQRYGRVNDIKEYINQVSSGEIEKCNSESLAPEQRLGETIMLRLRLLEEGVDISSLEGDMGCKLDDKRMALFQEMAEHGFFEVVKGRYILTQRGILNYDTIAGEFLG